jgi:glycosyltransferase involved in cell wall biosynthesis
MPIAVLEAMATALPIVSTDVGDVRQMVSEANRPFIVPPGDVQAYATALETLAGDPALRGQIGEQNRQRCCEEFGFARMLQRHRTLYELCMGVADSSSANSDAATGGR